MESIRINNFRSIVDSGEIKLNELNLLIGQNSSGKSSFLRLFPMFKESARHELMGPILWFNDNYDFGGFQTALSRHGASNEISFSFQWKHPDFTSYDLTLGEIINYSPISMKTGDKCSLSFSVSKNTGRVFISKLHFSVGNDYSLTCESTRYDSNVKVSLNNIVISDNIVSQWNYGTKNLLPVLSIKNYNFFSAHEVALELLGISNNRPNKVGYYSVFEGSTVYKSDNDINAYLEYVSKEYGRAFMEKINRDNSLYKKLSNILYMQTAKGFITYASNYLSLYFDHSYYITPLRYNFLRYMRNRELSIDYIESSGKNVLEYLLSLNKKDLESYSAFIKDTLDISISVVGDDNKSIEVINSDGEKDNIVDIGYGFSQILPIATTLWDRAYMKSRSHIPETVVIEQPEVHLHPAMQAGLAKLFVSAINLAKKREKKLCLIVETHSSRLVNKIGRYVYNSSNRWHDENDICFPASSASLFLFEKRKGVTTIRQTEYDVNGRIIDWPMGFLD